MPKVSVLVPTYNYGRYLTGTLGSILSQTLTDFELIVSDDNSSDNTAEIVSRLAARDPRIRFHRHPQNLGMVQNWNWCLHEARGDYVKYVFGDDTLHSPLALKDLAGLLDAHPGVTLATSARLIIDEHSNALETIDHIRKNGLHNGPYVVSECLRKRCNFIGEPSAVMFRRKNAARGFLTSYRQVVDLEMWIHLLEQGALAYTRTPLCSFRRHAEQQTAVNNQANIGQVEHERLIDDYSHHLIPPHAGSLKASYLRFREVAGLKRNRNITPAGLERTHRFAKEFGPICFAALWAFHRIVRVKENLVRSWNTHALRRPAPSRSFNPSQKRFDASA